MCAVCIAFTAFHLKMDMNRDNLVGPDKKYHQIFLKFRKEFPGEDELVVVVESEDMERNRQFIERLAAKMEPETNIFTDVLYKNDFTMLGKKALLFVPEENLKEISTALTNFAPFIQQFSKATNLDSLFGLVNKQIRTAKKEDNADNQAMMGAIPAVQRIIEQAEASIVRRGEPPSPGVNAIFGVGDEAVKQQYVVRKNGRIMLLTARARTAGAAKDEAEREKKQDELSAAAVEKLRALIAQAAFEVPGLNVGLTGEPVLEYDEAHQSEHDSIVASIASLIICSLIFIYAYNGTGRPLKAVACLIVGLGYTMGFTTLVIGHLNILTITFAPILIGLAIDFGIHFISRYEEETRNGSNPAQAVETAMVFTGQGIVTGALTTAGAFLAMSFTNFKGIQEMGTISGGGLVLCLIPMLTMLPVLLMRGKQNVMDHAAVAREEQKRMKVENLWLGRPGLITAVTIILCGLAVVPLLHMHFDYDLLKLQSKGLPAVEYEKKLIDSAADSVLFAGIIADSPEQAKELAKKIQNLPSVGPPGEAAELTKILTEDQSGKMAWVKKIKVQAEQFHFAPVDRKPVEVHELSPTLWYTMTYFGNIVEDRRKAGDTNLATQMAAMHDAVSSLRVKMGGDDPIIPEKLSQFQQALFDDLHDTFDALQHQDTSGSLKPEDLPPPLRDRFVGVTGKYLLAVYPKKNIWEHENQGEFVKELRAAVGEDKVTGMPVQLYEYATLLKESYVQAAWYSLMAIVVMVFFHFRSLLCVVLAQITII